MSIRWFRDAEESSIASPFTTLPLPFPGDSVTINSPFELGPGTKCPSREIHLLYILLVPSIVYSRVTSCEDFDGINFIFGDSGHTPRNTKVSSEANTTHLIPLPHLPLIACSSEGFTSSVLHLHL